MPTYNDEKYISVAIDSVVSQNYPNWELIVIDDGSNDNTSSIVESYQDDRIVYKYQENQGQLNALISGSKSLTGDIVTFLHSDDYYIDNHVLKSFIDSFVQNPDIDGLYGDLYKVNNKGIRTEMITLMTYKKNNVIHSVLSNFGSNPLSDIFVVKRNVYYEVVFSNYLINNTIYYINYDKAEPLNLQKIRPWYCYRVFEENYINSDVGQFVVLNGKLRTSTLLLKAGLQLNHWTLFCILSYKITKKTSKFLIHRTIENPQFSTRYLSIWYKLLLKKNYCTLALDVLKASIASYDESEGTIYDIESENFKLYEGKDARLFYIDLKNGTVDKIYSDLIYMNISKIRVANDMIEKKVRKVLFFLSLNYRVTIK